MQRAGGSTGGPVTHLVCRHLNESKHAFSGLFCQTSIQHNVSAKAAQRVNQLAVTDIVNISVTHSVAALDSFFFLSSHFVFIFA